MRDWASFNADVIAIGPGIGEDPTEADALLIRPAGAPAAASGSEVGYIAL